MGKTLMVQAHNSKENTAEYMTNVDSALSQMFPAHFKRNRSQKLEKNVRGLWEVVIDRPEFEAVIRNWLAGQFRLTIVT